MQYIQCFRLNIILITTTILIFGLPAQAAKIKHDGIKRDYFIHVPKHYNKKHPTPLVFVLHGGGGTARKAKRFGKFTGFNKVSDRENFIAVYPVAYEKHWNDSKRSGTKHSWHIDDVGFFKKLIKHMSKHFNIDKKRIYATGMSNGGAMSFKLACSLSDQIAAIAPVSSFFPKKLREECKPGRPVPVLLINGTKDPLVPWQGGELHMRKKKLGKIMAANNTIDFWANNNQCKKQAFKTTMLPDTDPKDGTRVSRKAYRQCANNANVTLYTITNGGHTWPGGKQFLPKFIVGRASQDIKASDVVWNFFKQHKLP